MMFSEARRNSATKIISRLRSGSLPGWAGGGPILPSYLFPPEDGQDDDEIRPVPSTELALHPTSIVVIGKKNSQDHDPELWRRHGNAGLGSILSGMYGKILVVMGIAFPMSEVMSTYIPPSYYDGFYLYLYFVSIIFMSCMFANVMKQRAQRGITKGVSNLRSRLNKNPPDVVKSDIDSDSEISDTLAPLPKKQELEKHNNHLHSNGHSAHGSLAPEILSSKSPHSNLMSRENSVDSNWKADFNRQRSHFGSFYLRIGAVAFGIGGMIYSGLEFGQYFEIEDDGVCQSFMVAITPAVRMIFTFMQMYFIFLNSRMAVSKVSLAKQFGLMHLIGTNLCVWLDVLVEETKHEILHFYDPENGTITVGHGVNPVIKSMYIQPLHSSYSRSHGQGQDISDSWTPNEFQANYLGLERINSTGNGNSTGADLFHLVRHKRGLKGPHSMYDCRRTNIMGSLVDGSSHFLFPCTIEYSLICAAICYVMWKSMAKRRVAKITLKRSPTADSGINTLHQGENRSPHHYTVDCAGSNKGLFIGIFFLVLTIMSLILNFVLIKHEDYRRLATLEVNVAEIVLYTTSTLAVLLGMCQMRQLRYDSGKNLELDNILLVVAQSGSFVFNVFCIIAGHLMVKTDDHFVLVTPLLCLIQLLLQTLFILDASKRVAATAEQARRKPGREVVTFLLVCNLAMWLVNALEKSRGDSHPHQLYFYGVWAWTIITDISMPLAIFYRFHSTVCLCEIWKKAYKINKATSPCH